MEAWESSDRIRPLPPEAPPGSAPPSGPGDSPRRWIPLAIAGVALGAFAVGATLLTSGEPSDSVAATTTTTTTTTTVPPLAEDVTETTTTTRPPPPPTLVARLPGLTNVATVVVADGGTVQELWTAGSREAEVIDTQTDAEWASYNVDGSLVALLRSSDLVTGALSLGSDRFATRALDVLSVAWHDTDPERIAFISIPPTESGPVLFTARVDPVNYELSELTALEPTGTDWSIAAWGSWGFAVNGFAPMVVALEETPDDPVEAEAPTTLILDPAGIEVGGTEGWIVDALPAGQLLLRTFWDTIDITEDGIAIITERHVVTRTDPSLTPSGQFELLTPSSVAFLNPTGPTMSEFTLNPSGVTLITTRNFDRPSNRSASVPGFLEPLGFSADGRRFILSDPMERELVFLDWSNSSQVRLPVSSSVIVAVDAR